MAIVMLTKHGEVDVTVERELDTALPEKMTAVTHRTLFTNTNHMRDRVKAVRGWDREWNRAMKFWRSMGNISAD